MNYKLSLMTD